MDALISSVPFVPWAYVVSVRFLRHCTRCTYLHYETVVEMDVSISSVSFVLSFMFSRYSSCGAWWTLCLWKTNVEMDIILSISSVSFVPWALFRRRSLRGTYFSSQCFCIGLCQLANNINFWDVGAYNLSLVCWRVEWEGGGGLRKGGGVCVMTQSIVLWVAMQYLHAPE